MTEITQKEARFLREQFKGKYNVPHLRVLNRKHRSQAKTYIVEERRDVIRLLDQFNNSIKSTKYER